MYSDLQMRFAKDGNIPICLIFPIIVQWRIQDFPDGYTNPNGGAPTFYLANFPQKLHENEEILGQGARGKGHEGRQCSLFVASPDVYE